MGDRRRCGVLPNHFGQLLDLASRLMGPVWSRRLRCRVDFILILITLQPHNRILTSQSDLAILFISPCTIALCSHPHGGIKQRRNPSARLSVRLSVCPMPVAQNGAFWGYGYYTTVIKRWKSNPLASVSVGPPKAVETDGTPSGWNLIIFVTTCGNAVMYVLLELDNSLESKLSRLLDHIAIQVTDKRMTYMYCFLTRSAERNCSAVPHRHCLPKWTI